MALAAGRLGRAARISSPTGTEPVNAIVCTRGSRDQRRADVALTGQQRERVRRHARLVQRPHEHERAAGRLLGGLEHDRVAGRERRRRSSRSGIASGKFQGEITATTPRGR